MARVGAVLGAGGIVGGAWHAGVLAALAEATGWDARTAEVLVGTSAGSITAATLRAGLSPADQHAAACARPPSADGQALLDRVSAGQASFERVPPQGRRRPANPLLLRSLASLDPRPGVALAGLLPQGEMDPSPIGERVEELNGGPGWPGEPLWVVAVRLADGRRSVFGRDGAPPEGLGTAVAASCAIPGWFTPVRVDGHQHVDGGTHSTTNADLLAGLGLDAVVVSAPMAGAWRSLRRHPAAVSRATARVHLERELTALRRGGTPVLVLQPGPDDTPLMDGRAMDTDARRPVAEQAHRSALALLEEPHAADVVDVLRAAAG